MIPKKIHYCWFGGNPIPEKDKKCIESWKKYCPDYEIIEWNESNYDLNKNQYMAEAYKERGRAKLLNGDKDGSVEDMKKSLELNPKDEANLNGEFKNLGPKPEALPGIF